MNRTHFSCDADGVLLNFNKAAREALRMAGYEIEEKEPNSWTWYEIYGIHKDDFWDAIHVLGSRFYNNIVGVYPWASKLMSLLQSAGDVSILTKMTDDAPTYYGKIKLLQRFFPGVPIITMSHDEKYLVAGPGRVLVDDNNENIDSFRNSMGTGIFWPQPWNRAGLTFPDSKGNERIEYVRHQLATNGLVYRI